MQLSNPAHKRISLFLRFGQQRLHTIPHQKVYLSSIKSQNLQIQSLAADVIHINSDVVYMDYVGVFINHVGVYRFYTDKETFITASFRKPMPATPPNSLLKGRINRSTYKESRKKMLSFSSYPITTSKSLFFHIYMWNDILIICFQFHVQIPKALLLFSSKI